MEIMHMNDEQKRVMHQLQKHSSWFMTLGVMLVIFGFLAVIFASVSTIFSVLYVGVLFVALGIAELVKAFKARSLNKFFLVHMLLALLYNIAGVFMVFYPVQNAVTLTLAFGILFIIAGALRIFFALTQAMPHRGWVLLNGCITALLGILILREWPQSGLWIIGLFVGVNALFTGMSWIMLSSAIDKNKMLT